MVINLRYIRLVIASLILLAAFSTGAWATGLPIIKNLTIRLSTLDSHGKLQTVSEITSKTDAQGKLSFNFPVVPSSTDTPFLHIQFMDGATVLRQTIVPSPQKGENVDIGVSEVTDLHARAILKASAISGQLSPLHLFVAQVLLRSPNIDATTAESLGTIIDAGVTAFKGVLAADNLTSDQLTTFMSSLSKGLAGVSAIYRQSVDDSIFTDQNVEAYKRGEAFAELLQTVISAANDAGINLETITTAYGAIGSTTEPLIGLLSNVTTVAKASMRFGFVSGMSTLNNYKWLWEIRKSLNNVGMAPPTFPRIFDVLDLMQGNTFSMQKGYDKALLVASLLNDANAILTQEYNILASQDLLLFKVSMEIAFSSYNSNPDAINLMLQITSRMTSMGGVMSGMTPDILMDILGRTAAFPAFSVAQQAAAQPTSVATLRPFELAAWSYIANEPRFIYTPIAGLVDQLTAKPTIIPQFDRLAEPYKSIALLSYDLNLIRSLRSEEQTISQNTNPIPLSAYNQIQNNERQRLAQVRQHITGTSADTSSALIYLLLPYITTF